MIKFYFTHLKEVCFMKVENMAYVTVYGVKKLRFSATVESGIVKIVIRDVLYASKMLHNFICSSEARKLGYRTVVKKSINSLRKLYSETDLKRH